jgi:hypothetical protein
MFGMLARCNFHKPASEFDLTSDFDFEARVFYDYKMRCYVIKIMSDIAKLHDRTGQAKLHDLVLEPRYERAVDIRYDETNTPDCLFLAFLSLCSACTRACASTSKRSQYTPRVAIVHSPVSLSLTRRIYEIEWRRRRKINRGKCNENTKIGLNKLQKRPC